MGATCPWPDTPAGCSSSSASACSSTQSHCCYLVCSSRCPKCQQHLTITQHFRKPGIQEYNPRPLCQLLCNNGLVITVVPDASAAGDSSIWFPCAEASCCSTTGVGTSLWLGSACAAVSRCWLLSGCAAACLGVDDSDCGSLLWGFFFGLLSSTWTPLPPSFFPGLTIMPAGNSAFKLLLGSWNGLARPSHLHNKLELDGIQSKNDSHHGPLVRIQGCQGQPWLLLPVAALRPVLPPHLPDQSAQGLETHMEHCQHMSPSDFSWSLPKSKL